MTLGVDWALVAAAHSHTVCLPGPLSSGQCWSEALGPASPQSLPADLWDAEQSTSFYPEVLHTTHGKCTLKYAKTSLILLTFLRAWCSSQLTLQCNVITMHNEGKCSGFELIPLFWHFQFLWTTPWVSVCDSTGVCMWQADRLSDPQKLTSDSYSADISPPAPTAMLGTNCSPLQVSRPGTRRCRYGGYGLPSMSTRNGGGIKWGAVCVCSSRTWWFESRISGL
jgi:hypothetical protein